MHAVLPALFLVATLAFAGPSTVPPGATLHNGDFQQGPLGQAPMGWLLPGPCVDAGFQCLVAEDPSLPGKRCAVLSQESCSPATFGNLMQTLPAAPYRGKRIRLTGQLRMDSKGDCLGQGQMWLRVDRPGTRIGFLDNMAQRPASARTWTRVEIVGDVALDAEWLAMGVMLVQGGKLFIGPMTLETLGEAHAAEPEGPRALTRQGLRNLAAFAQAFSYVRFFHPSDEAAKADWNRLAAAGVRAVEGAGSSRTLARRLQTLFAPYAPSAQFLAPGQKPRAPKREPGATRAVRWTHLGFGQNNPQNVYHSTREYLPLGPSGLEPWPDPLATAPLNLGGGLRLFLPSVLRATPVHTVPVAVAVPGSAMDSPLPAPTAGAGATLADRSTRLGDVVLAWGILQHFYPYFDVVQTNWKAELPRALRAAALDPDEQAFGHTLRCMVAALKDGHGAVTDLLASAVPALELVILDGSPIVLAGSAAAVAPGSRILRVDGEGAEARLARLRKEISAATEGWMNARLARTFLAGAPNKPVVISFLTPSGAVLSATLPRDPDSWAQLRALKPQPLSELKPGIWYVDLERISDQDFATALPDLAKARGVVFDLRGYPRVHPAFLQHLTDKPLRSAHWNIPVVTQPDGKGWGWNTLDRWELEPRLPRLAGKVAFLAGGGTISYAESCLGIVEAYGLAEIVGEPTAGTNGNVNPIDLPGGLILAWTGMKVLKHDGTPHHGVGIRPTVPVKPTLQGLAAGRDEVLEKGLEVVAR